jgi:YD repeat-containing protein
MAYDSLGNVLSTTDELSRVTTFEYDALNRQSKVTQPDPDDTGSLPAIETETFYDKVGNSILTRTTAGTDIRETGYAYDVQNRVIATYRPDASGSSGLVFDSNLQPLTTVTLTTTTSEFDLFGNLVLTTDAAGRETAYKYDRLNRRIEVRTPEPNILPTDTAQIGKAFNVSTGAEIGIATRTTYDDVGNVLTVTTQDIDSDDRLTINGLLVRPADSAASRHDGNHSSQCQGLRRIAGCARLPRSLDRVQLRSLGRSRRDLRQHLRRP